MSAGLSVKEENILRLKLILQRRTGSHSVLLGVKEQNILTLKLKLTLFFECGFEYARFTLAFSFPALVSQRGLCGSEV